MDESNNDEMIHAVDAMLEYNQPTMLPGGIPMPEPSEHPLTLTSEQCEIMVTLFSLEHTDASASPVSVASAAPPVKRRARLPKPAVAYMRQWALLNAKSPHPCQALRAEMALKIGITAEQVTTWFHNYRKRHWVRTDRMKKGVHKHFLL